MPYIKKREDRVRQRMVEVLQKKRPLDLDIPLRDDNWVSSPFGMRMHPIDNVRKMHNGIDFAAQQGTPIYAADDGWVDQNVPDDVGGFKLVVKHPGGYRTKYLHMSRMNPQFLKGGEVKRGDVVGWVGTTGKSTGPHLHFGVTKDDQPVDPQPYFYSSYRGY